MINVIDGSKKLEKPLLKEEQYLKEIVTASEPYKKANRKFHPEDTVIDIMGRKVGGNNLTIIGGPCAVESEDQLTTISESVKESGAGFLRGGTFKPRTSPYSFQGLEYKGLDLLKKAREKTGLPIVTEIMSPYDIDRFERDVDIIQVGSRNMQNFHLLKALGKVNKPILLKRGLCSTIEEWLLSAEYIMSEGNDKVILCERGIRTFETYTRNTLDISAILAVKKLSHLPLIVDPSHATGHWWMVEPLSKAAIAAGADGVIVEVHHDPKNALCDGPQSIKLDNFKNLASELHKLGKFLGKNV